jgi:hypothetical protein
MAIRAVLRAFGFAPHDSDPQVFLLSEGGDDAKRDDQQWGILVNGDRRCLRSRKDQAVVSQ